MKEQKQTKWETDWNSYSSLLRDGHFSSILSSWKIMFSWTEENSKLTWKRGSSAVSFSDQFLLLNYTHLFHDLKLSCNKNRSMLIQCLVIKMISFSVHKCKFKKSTNERENFMWNGPCTECSLWFPGHNEPFKSNCLGATWKKSRAEKLIFWSFCA